MTELNAVIEKIGVLSEEMKNARLQDAEEIKKLGAKTNESHEKWEKMNERMDQLEDMKDRIEQIQTAVKRISENETEEKSDAYEEYHAKAIDAIRTGARFDAKQFAEDHKDLNVKLLATDSNPDGGYWITPDRSGRTVKIEFPTSPMRMVASVQNTSKPFLEGIYDGDEPTAQTSGEREDRSNNENETPEIGIWRINTHIYSTDLPVTESMLEDSDFDVEQWLVDKGMGKIRRDENADFVNGSGNGKARGILSYPDGTVRGTVQQIESSVSTLFNIEDWLEMEESIKDEYLTTDAVYMAHRKTVGLLRRLVDSEGRPLWEPSLQAGQPSVFNGYRVIKAEDFPAPTAGVFTAGDLAMAFGNFRRGYQIADRRGIRVVRDIFTKRPKIVLGIDERVGGDVVNFEAFKLLKIKA